MSEDKSWKVLAQLLYEQWCADTVVYDRGTSVDEQKFAHVTSRVADALTAENPAEAVRAMKEYVHA